LVYSFWFLVKREKPETGNQIFIVIGQKGCYATASKQKGKARAFPFYYICANN